MAATNLYFELEGKDADYVIRKIKFELKEYLSNTKLDLELITLETGYKTWPSKK